MYIIKTILCILLLDILGTSIVSHAQVYGIGAIASSQLESTAAQRFIDAAVITDATEKSAVRRLVADLSGVVNGSYNVSNTFHKFIILYPFLGGTATTCSYNLKDPTTFQFTIVNGASAPTFSSAGYIGSTTSYLRTGMTPSTSMTTNDRSISIRAVSSVGQATAASDANSSDGSGRSMRIRVRAASDTYDATNGNTTPITLTNASTSTVYAVNSRTSSTSFILYKNGTNVGSQTASSSTTGPTVEMPIGGSNNSGVFTAIGVSRTYNFFTAGRGLTSTEVTDLHNAQDFFNTTTLGR